MELIRELTGKDCCGDYRREYEYNVCVGELISLLDNGNSYVHLLCPQLRVSQRAQLVLAAAGS